MARLARVKVEDAGAYYHLCGRTAGPIGEYPLADKRTRRKIVDFVRLFAKVYCCEVLGFSIMGNHYHLVARMDAPRSRIFVSDPITRHIATNSPITPQNIHHPREITLIQPAKLRGVDKKNLKQFEAPSPGLNSSFPIPT